MEDGGGGPDRGPFTPAFRDVDVVPEDLSQFAGLVSDDRDALRTSWERAREALQADGDPNFAGGYPRTVSLSEGYPVVNEGSDGIEEGGEFFRGYFLTLAAQLRLVEDVLAGLATLQQAASTIHDDYLAGDTGSAGTLDGTFAAYERSAVERALDDVRAVDGEPGP